MDTQNQITKRKVHEIFTQSKNGSEIAKAVAAYFKINRKPDILEVAKEIFNPVITPGVGIGMGQYQHPLPGYKPAPRTT